VFWRRAGGSRTLAHMAADKLEARINGLVDVFGCTRELVCKAAAEAPSVLTTQTVRVAAKHAKIVEIVQRSGNPAWIQWATEPPSTTYYLRAFILASDTAIGKC
jgi:hypothetical protein